MQGAGTAGGGSVDFPVKGEGEGDHGPLGSSRSSFVGAKRGGVG